MVRTGNAAHNAACLAADAVYQSAIAGTPTMAVPHAADITRVRAYRASALANGIPDGQYVAAFRELGTGGF
jgi:hypothetical protein